MPKARLKATNSPAPHTPSTPAPCTPPAPNTPPAPANNVLTQTKNESLPTANRGNEEMDAETAISKESETALVLAMDTKVETLIKEHESMNAKLAALETKLENDYAPL